MKLNKVEIFILLTASPWIFMGAGDFSDRCSSLANEIEFTLVEERVMQLLNFDNRPKNERLAGKKMVVEKKRDAVKLRKKLTAEAEKLHCNLPPPPTSDELDQLARAEMSRLEKARNSPTPKADSSKPSSTPDSFKTDFIALFPELECRNWHITPRKEDGTAAWQQKFHYTVVAKAKKRVTLDGLEYPAQSELFLEGHAEDLYNHGSQKKVFRRIRILPRSP